MKNSRKILGTFSTLLIVAIIGLMVSSITGLNPVGTTSGALFLSVIPKPGGAFLSGLDVEIWKPWIVEQLFKNNDFLTRARNADGDVVKGTIVHIANAGTASSIARNRKSLPATIKKRTDVDITYALDEFTSDPRLVTELEKVLSYDKMASIMGQDMGAIRQLVAEWMLYNWRAEGSTNIVRTTGSSILSHLPSATGNRKALSLTDLEEAQARFNEANLPDDGRAAMFSSRMYMQLVKELSTTTYRDFSPSLLPSRIAHRPPSRVLDRSH
jgi:hypothetical protein